MSCLQRGRNHSCKSICAKEKVYTNIFIFFSFDVPTCTGNPANSLNAMHRNWFDRIKSLHIYLKSSHIHEKENQNAFVNRVYSVSKIVSGIAFFLYIVLFLFISFVVVSHFNSQSLFHEWSNQMSKFETPIFDVEWYRANARYNLPINSLITSNHKKDNSSKSVKYDLRVFSKRC